METASLAFLGAGSSGDFPKPDCGPVSQQRAHCPSALAPEQFPPLLGLTVLPVGWLELQEGQKWALTKRGDEEHFKGENQTKSFQI